MLNSGSTADQATLHKTIKNVVYTIFLCSASYLHAQSTPSLAGLVQDPSNAVIASAQVRLLSEQGKVLEEQHTDAAGKFHLRHVPERGQRLQVSEAGFRDAEQVVSTRVGGAPIVITLQIEAEKETVDVNGSVYTRTGTDIASNQNAIDLSRNALDRLPVFDADYIATLSRFLDQNSLATSGIALVVNGIEANGPGVTASAVKSIKINQNPYSVLFSRPGRARLELETEGGTPNFHGTVNYLKRDAVFDAQPAFAAVKPSERRDYVEGSLTGPLLRSKKITFLGSGQFDEDHTQAIVLAATPTGTVNEAVPNPAYHLFVSGRGFHDYGQSNQFWAGYSYERETNANLGVGGTVLREAGTNVISYEHEINVQDRYVVSPKLVNVGHFLIGHNLDRISSTTQAAQINVVGSFTGGGAQADSLRTESHFDGADVVTYSTGKEVVTFGIDVPDISRRGNDDFTNRQGTYSFNDLQRYQSSTPFQYVVQTGSGHVTLLEKVVAGFFADNIRLSSRLSIEAGLRYYFQNYFNDVVHNVAPRLSLAFAASRRGTTVIRGGAGVFFDRTGPSPIADLLHYNGRNIARYIVLDPKYPATAAQANANPTSLVTLDPRIRIPYTVQYGIGVEQQVTAKSSLALSYQGSRGIDLFRSINTNAPLPQGSKGLPFSGLGQVRQIQSDGYLKADSLELSFRGEPNRFLTGQIQYLLSKTLNNTSDIRYFPANSYDPQADWSRSDNDIRNNLNLLSTVHGNGWFDLGVAFSTHSGAPVNVTTGNDDNQDGVINDRPIETPRNSLHGPSFLDLDLNLSREFRLSKHKDGPTATASISSFNVTNHQNDTTYVGVITSPFFGTAVTAQPPRRMQVSVQIKF